MQSGVVYNIQRMSTKDGPGMRTTVFLKGCPLRCPWCSNPESQEFAPQLLVFENLCQSCGACLRDCPHGAVCRNDQSYNRNLHLCKNCGCCEKTCPSSARVMSGKSMSVEEVMEVVDRDSLFYMNSDGGVTLGGGEPTCAGEFAVELLQACRRQGYHTCVDTCGMCPPEQFNKIIALTDLFLYDCKHMDPEAHRKLTGQDNVRILENLQAALQARCEVRIRVPLMPRLNDGEDNIIALASFLHKHQVDSVDVMPCHHFGGTKYDALLRPRPALREYEPQELKQVLECFSRHGLRPSLA